MNVVAATCHTAPAVGAPGTLWQAYLQGLHPLIQKAADLLGGHEQEPAHHIHVPKSDERGMML